MVSLVQRICEPHPPAACDPLRRIAPPEPMVHTAPAPSTICDALIGTVVPSGDVGPPPGVVLPTFSQPDPVHRHQLLSVPKTWMVLLVQRIFDPHPPAAWTPLRRMA